MYVPNRTFPLIPSSESGKDSFLILTVRREESRPHAFTFINKSKRVTAKTTAYTTIPVKKLQYSGDLRDVYITGSICCWNRCFDFCCNRFTRSCCRLETSGGKAAAKSNASGFSSLMLHFASLAYCLGCTYSTSGSTHSSGSDMPTYFALDKMGLTPLELKLEALLLI